MADRQYLDVGGLTRLIQNLVEKFALKTHSHDDVYYTETEIDSKLANYLQHVSLSVDEEGNGWIAASNESVASTE